MVKRNPHIAKLEAGYLFPEIRKRKEAFLLHNPDAKIIDMSIGDTTQPIPRYVTNKMKQAAEDLGTLYGYTGYGPEQGLPVLREKISKKLYGNLVESDEIFISDGAKCDVGRLQHLFGDKTTVAVQDPSYPVYIDTSVIAGKTYERDIFTNKYYGIVYMPCTQENDFFPNLDEITRTDIIYFCSPNNPTGAVATKSQLKQLVSFAKNNRSVIIFDTAYSHYIQDPSLPKSIYEIEGAREVAIEVGSFSKMAGFTGIRLGWTIVPKGLRYDDGTPLHQDWSRITSTFFNGASIIAQKGGMATLDDQGLSGADTNIQYYLDNAKIMKTTLEDLGYQTFGGTNSPFIWVHFPKRKSWDIFDELLENNHIVGIPGSGFGPGGENYFRFSTFTPRQKVEEACKRLKAVKNYQIH